MYNSIALFIQEEGSASIEIFTHLTFFEHFIRRYYTYLAILDAFIVIDVRQKVI